MTYPLFYITLMIVAAIVPLIAGLYAVRYRHAPGGWALIGICTCACLWCLSQLGELNSPALESKLLWNDIGQFGAMMLSVCWATFALYYTDQGRRLTPVIFLVLSVIPAIISLVAWFSPIPGLFRLEASIVSVSGVFALHTSRGLLGLVGLFYAYSLMIFSTFVLLAYMVRMVRAYRTPFLIVFAAIVTMWIGNYFSLFGGPMLPINTLPISAAISCLLLVWALSARENEFEVMPVARDALFEHFNDSLLVIDGQDRIIDINPAGERQFAQPAKKLVGQSVLQASAELASLLAEHKGNTRTLVNVSLPNGDGRHDFGLQIAPITNRQGRLAGHVVALHDTTTQKQAEDALRQSEERFQRVADVTRDVIYEIDYRTGAVWWSRGIAVQFGFAETEVQPTQDWWRSLIHPEDRDKVSASFDMMVQSGGQFWSREYRVHKGDDEEAYVFDRGYMSHDETGKPLRFIGAVMDITARRMAEDALRQSEERYRRLVETAQEGIWVTDTNGNTTFVNQRMAEMLGYAVSEMTGKPMYQFMDDDGIATMSAGLEGQAGGSERYDLKFKRRDGGDLWTILSIRSILGEHGQYLGATAMVTDVTARKQGEDELRQQKQLFENLVAVARVTTELPSLQATLTNILDVSVTLTRAEGGNLWQLDEFGQVMGRLAVGATEQQMIAEHGKQIIESGLTGWAAKHRQTALVANTATDPRWLSLPGSTFEGGSALCVPILSNNQLLGIITLLHTQPDHFTQADKTLMEAAVAQMGLALRNATMLEQTQQLAEEMYMLNQITRAAVEATTLDELYQTLANRMGELLKADACYITAWDEATQTVLGRATSREDWREGYKAFTTQPGERTVTHAVLDTGRALAIDDLLTSDLMSRRIAEAFSSRSVLGLPLIARGRKLGAVLFDFREPHHFTSEEIATGERAARQVALSVSNAMLYKEIADQHGQLQALIESSRDGIILIGLTRRVLFCNTMALTLLGLTGQASDWVDAPLFKALKFLNQRAHPVVVSAVREMRRIRQGDEPLTDGEFELGGRSLHWLNLPVIASHESLGRLVVIRDVTEERALERMRDDLTHMMVHDLRSPLTVMMIATETLESAKGSRRKAESDMLTMIRDASTRMLNLVDAILDLSQLEANRMPMERTPIALSVLADKLFDLNIGIAEKKHIKLTFDVPKELPYAWADMRLTDRVIQNLLNNALKFTPEGGRIQLTVRCDNSKQPGMLISLFNSGEGIPPEIKGRLFQKFVRGRQKEHGNGLGLAFCRLVVEAHEGRIWAENEPGRGVTFYFTLPIHHESE